MAWANCSKKIVIHERLVLSVRTAWAIHLKKIVIRLNGSGYPHEKEIVDHLSDWSYLFKDKF